MTSWPLPVGECQVLCPRFLLALRPIQPLQDPHVQCWACVLILWAQFCIVDLLNSQGSPGNEERFALKQESYCLHSTAYHLIRKMCF